MKKSRTELQPCSVIEYHSYAQRKKSSKKYRLRVYQYPALEPFDFILIREIKTDAFRRLFEKWMDGRERPVILGLDKQDAVYYSDFESFLSICAGGKVEWD